MSALDMRKRNDRRFVRGNMEAVAWCFVASPVVVVALDGGRYSVGEVAVMPAVGVLMLVWFKRHPGTPEHLASVELVKPSDYDDYDGPDARTDAFYLAWCDCGWSGDDQPDEQSARAEAQSHTQHVRAGLHTFGE
jgi:hypothetical protein